MDRRIIILVLSFGILFSFFMPLFDWHSFEMNGLNYILSTHIPSYKYFLAGIPACAAFLFFSAIYGEDYFLNKKLLYWVPFIILVFVFMMRAIAGEPDANLSGRNNLFSDIDLGFWLTLGFSVLLVFVKKEQGEARQRLTIEIE